MKYSILVTVSVLAISAVFSGCDGGSSQPGNQAGYASDGSGNCSESLVGDYNTIVVGLAGVQGLIDTQSNMGGDVEQQELQEEQSEITTVSAEYSAFQSNYGAVSCTAINDSDGSTTTVDPSQMNTIGDAINTIQQELNAETSPPVAGVPNCSSSGMFTDNLTISTDITLAQNSVQAAEANVDPTQKRQGLEAAQAQLQTASALLTTYNNEYAGAYCDLNGEGTLDASSLSGPEATQITQLDLRIETDLAAL